jgi:hypothetical protein
MDGVKFVLREGFGIPFVFEVDSDGAESVKLELGKRQGWSIIKYPYGFGNAIESSKIVAFYWEILLNNQVKI